jgi:hypothetical protein
MYDAHNFHRVQKLAILLDSKGDRDCQYQLAQVLSLFGNIRELKVVVGHFDEHSDSSGNVIFIEPLDVTKTCQNYETFSAEQLRRDEIPDLQLTVDFISTTELERHLEGRRQSDRVRTSACVL